MPSETTLLGEVGVTKPQRDGSRFIVVDTMDGRVYKVPLSESAAESIGSELTAAHVHVPATIELPGDNGKVRS